MLRANFVDARMVVSGRGDDEQDRAPLVRIADGLYGQPVTQIGNGGYVLHQFVMPDRCCTEFVAEHTGRCRNGSIIGDVGRVHVQVCFPNIDIGDQRDGR